MCRCDDVCKPVSSEVIWSEICAGVRVGVGRSQVGLGLYGTPNKQ